MKKLQVHLVRRMKKGAWVDCFHVKPDLLSVEEAIEYHREDGDLTRLVEVRE